MIREVNPEEFASKAASIQVPSEFAPLWSDLEHQDFGEAEHIIFETEPGEVAQFTSATNVGKTTLLLNISLTLACGGEMYPLVKPGRIPRRVLYLDFETRLRRAHSDLRQMTRHLTEQERELIRRNFAISCDYSIGEVPLSLSNKAHMSIVTLRAKALNADLIIIDTAAAAFDMNNENDNAEVARKIQKPLIHLARTTGAAVIYSHHIGKVSEDGAKRESGAYRGRGASAYGCFARTVFNLLSDGSNPDRVTLVCAKSKGERFPDTIMSLDREARWFRPTNDVPLKPVTNDDLVLEMIRASGRSEIKTSEILKALAGRVKQRTIKNCLDRLVDRGEVVSPRRGFWSLTEDCASCATPISDLHNCTNSENGQNPLPENNFKQNGGNLKAAQA